MLRIHLSIQNLYLQIYHNLFKFKTFFVCFNKELIVYLLKLLFDGFITKRMDFKSGGKSS